MRPRLPSLSLQPWLLTLASLLVGLHLTFSLTGDRLYSLFQYIGLSTTALTKLHLWTLMSYSLFHHPEVWLHVTLNTLSLLYLGGRLCHIIGSRQTLATLTIGILTAGLTHLPLSLLLHTTEQPLIGTSGGVCALLGLYCTLSPESRFYPIPVRARNLCLGLVVTSLLAVLIHPTLSLPGLSIIGAQLEVSPLHLLLDTSHACHLGGLLTGLIIGRRMLALPKLPPHFKKKKEKNSVT